MCRRTRLYVDSTDLFFFSFFPMWQNVFPVEYGPDFDTALETLVCEFFTRLEELLPIPDFKQVQRGSF